LNPIQPKKLFETIRIENGKAAHLNYHNKRLNQSRALLFGLHNPIDITTYLANPPSKGLYRAKLIYDHKEIQINYYAYKPKPIRSLKLIESDISYAFKALDRKHLESLREDADEYDDVLILKNGYLTDTSIANIALRQHGIWYTPAAPLLAGTTRARLLESGKLIPREIPASDIHHYDSLALMNAMIGFSILEKVSLSLPIRDI